jgi:cell division cycle protein 37
MTCLFIIYSCNIHFRIRSAEEVYMKMYTDEVDAFKQRLRKRAKDKREETLNELELEEKTKRIEASPGGLDPLEVFETLPEASFSC